MGLEAALIGGVGVSGLLGSAGSIAGALTQSQDQKFQGDVAIRLAEMQARVSELQAEEAIKIGKKQAARIQREGKRIRGAQRAAIAAQGIEIDTGSAADVQEDTARTIALDALQVRNNAWRAAWGHRFEAVSARRAGQLNFQLSRQAAGRTVLAGGAQALSQFSQSLFSVAGGLGGSFGRSSAPSTFGGFVDPGSGLLASGAGAFNLPGGR